GPWSSSVGDRNLRLFDCSTRTEFEPRVRLIGGTMCEWKLCNLTQSILICGMLAVPQLSAQLKTTQAQHLVDLTAQRHPEITGLELSVNHGQEGCVTIAATQAKDLGEKCDDDEAAALKTLKPFVEH